LIGSDEHFHLKIKQMLALDFMPSGSIPAA